MEVTDIASLGAQIMDIGEQLRVRREQRDSVNAEIAELEKKLRPLVTQYSKILAEMLGGDLLPQTAPTGAPPVAHVNGAGPPANEAANDALKKRIIKFLQNAEPGTAASEIADALKVDVSIVRAAMADMARAGR